MPTQTAMCMQTGLIFLLDRLTPEGYSELYRSFYRPLVSAFFNRTTDVKHIQQNQITYATRLAHLLRNFLSPGAGATLLDVGGSTGTVAEKFVQQFGYQATVIDPAPDELQVARSKGMNVFEGFVEDYPEGEQFDLVLMCQTIEHLNDLAGALASIRNLTSPEGYFYVDIVDFFQACALYGSIEAALHIDHCYNFTHEAAVHLFNSLGWQIMLVDTTLQVGHVGYLLKPVNEPLTVSPLDTQAHLLKIQQIQTEWQLASRQKPQNMIHKLKRTAYRLKKRIAGPR